MRDLEKDWAGCQDDFLEGIQHIVGKRGIILSFSDPNLNSSSSASMSSASLASSRRHSFIDYEMDIMRRDIEDMREESDNLRKELAAAKQETEDVKAQLRQQIRSPPLSSREMRDGSESEPLTSYGRREVTNQQVHFQVRFYFVFVAGPILASLKRKESSTLSLFYFLDANLDSCLRITQEWFKDWFRRRRRPPSFERLLNEWRRSTRTGLNSSL